jgi:predicted tellurium resistance membrane protein TerC
MLLGITWIIQFQEPIFSVFDTALSGRDLILLSGGLFLIFKSTREIHHKVSPDDDSQDSEPGKTARKSLLYIIIQIGILDIVFSFDSILTAIGMVQELSIMIMAVIISLVVMLAFSGPIARLVETYPTLQMLALSFLILIGFVLIADGLHQHISKGYIYVAVVFSLTVEVLNIQASKRKSAQSQK